MIQNYFGKTYFADLIAFSKTRNLEAGYLMLKKRPTMPTYEIRVLKIMRFLKSKTTSKIFYQGPICCKISC
jgi:hypothetical protein